MDSDLLISRLAASKRHYSLHHQRTTSPADRLNIEEFEVEEFRPDLQCPYCCEDHDVVSLCSHIEEEHSFESKAVACPICSAKIMKDMLNHIKLQHGHLFKLQRRRRLRRFSIPGSQALSLVGGNLHETNLQVLMGSGNSRYGNSHAANAVLDSLFSSLILNFPTSEVEEISKASLSTTDYSKKKWPSTSCRYSLDSSLSYEEKELRRRQATTRATFVQDVLLSALFED